MRARVLHSPGPARDVRFCLVFPRESLSIPVMRRVLGETLSRLGVDEDSVADLLLAVTEACTNVLRHAGPGRRYEVVVKVGRNRCVLQVLDNGQGIESGRLRMARRAHQRRAPRTDIQQLPESGRGLAIMRACVDDVSLRSGRGQGTVVQLRKRIELRDDAPLANLGDWPLRDVG
jgi:serine/threonine-protein kinase RsbW